jgi:tetratricopeptide (TPR) repeat protein
MNYVLSFLKSSALLSLMSLSATAAAHREPPPFYDPGTHHPLSLLEGPADGVSHYEARQRALSLFNSGQIAEAEALYEEVARQYPRDGMNWINLGFVKNRLGKYEEAAAAYERAGPLIGWGPWHVPRFLAAANHFLAGNRRRALELIRAEIFGNRSVLRYRLYDWPEFEALRDDPEFLALIGRPDPSGWTRDEGWVHDIDFLYAEVKRVNPDYHDRPFPAEFTKRYQDLRAAVPQLTDEQLLVGMERMIAVLDQGHMSILWPETAGRYLPLRFYAFPEGVFIIDADEAHSGLIGARVVNIGNLPVEDVLRRYALARSIDGPMAHVWGVNRIADAYRLKGHGVLDSSASALLTLQMPDGERRQVEVASLSEQLPGRQDRLAPQRDVEVPAFLHRMDEAHWEEALPRFDAHYVQVNNISDGPQETLSAFGDRLYSLLPEGGTKNLILDLRHNNGGSTSLYPQLLRTIIAFTRRPGTQLYVLIGRRTYSAAGNFITDLERLAAPLFVGEASSECCHFYGDPSLFVLPYSRILGEVTAVKWNLSQNVFDGRREMSPRVPVQLTAADYFAGRDPALNAVFSLIERRRSGIE